MPYVTKYTPCPGPGKYRKVQESIDKARSSLLMALTLRMPGFPMTYYLLYNEVEDEQTTDLIQFVSISW